MCAGGLIPGREFIADPNFPGVGIVGANLASVLLAPSLDEMNLVFEWGQLELSAGLGVKLYYFRRCTLRDDADAGQQINVLFGQCVRRDLRSSGQGLLRRNRFFDRLGFSAHIQVQVLSSRGILPPFQIQVNRYFKLFLLNPLATFFGRG